MPASDAGGQWYNDGSHAVYFRGDTMDGERQARMEAWVSKRIELASGEKVAKWIELASEAEVRSG